MNLAALRAAVKLRLRLPANGDPYLSDANINACINAALRDIGEEADWPWLLATAAVTFTNGLAPWPADAARLLELRVGVSPSWARAQRVGLAEFLDRSSGGGYVWTSEGGGSQMALSPVPTTSPTATVFYARVEPDLVSDTASPLIPPVHQQALIARASYHCNVARRNTEDAALDAAESTEAIKKMRRDPQFSSGPRRIRSAFRPQRWATW